MPGIKDATEMAPCLAYLLLKTLLFSSEKDQNIMYTDQGQVENYCHGSYIRWKLMTYQ